MFKSDMYCTKYCEGGCYLQTIRYCLVVTKLCGLAYNFLGTDPCFCVLIPGIQSLQAVEVSSSAASHQSSVQELKTRIQVRSIPKRQHRWLCNIFSDTQTLWLLTHKMTKVCILSTSDMIETAFKSMSIPLHWIHLESNQGLPVTRLT